MSGHSKWANIKHKKEKNDAAKGKIFTILGACSFVRQNCCNVVLIRMGALRLSYNKNTICPHLQFYR